MRRLLMVALLCCMGSCESQAQDMQAYTGNWQGSFAATKPFSLPLTLDMGTDTSFTIQTNASSLRANVNISAAGLVSAEWSPGLSFMGYHVPEQQIISGFLQSGALKYHMHMTEVTPGRYTGLWQIIMVDSLANPTLYLSIENAEGDQYEAYPFWGDNRFTGTWCGEFQKEGPRLLFSDFKTGMRFRGELGDGEITLGLYLVDALLAEVRLAPQPDDFQISNLTQSQAPLPRMHPVLQKMERQIETGSLPNVHGIYISQGNQPLYERYFAGYTPTLPHDMRSASKSIGSAMAGIALDQGLFASLDQSIYDFLPARYQSTKDAQKAQIDLLSLLTMRSGLDADDYASGGSAASEGRYQSSPDWTQTVLQAPMVHAPNTHANYGSANPFLLGLAVDSMVAEPLALFMDRTLFAPLGISNYIIQNDNVGQPYFGGGMYLTPRDMAKLGQLYLNKGEWDGQQILPAAWVAASFADYGPLENTPDQNHYGYLWWHHTYSVNGRRIASVEARGAGGQYIYVIPTLDAVVAITSGNFRNGKTQQPEEILEQYVLPFLVGE